jgi:uncharacterized protein (TIGR02246 family)
MSTRSVLLAALALALTSTACQPPAQEAAGLSEEDVAAIEAIPDAWAEATLAGDWAAVAALFTEDGVFMPPNEPAVEGRAAIEAWTSTNFGLLTYTEFTSEALEIDGRGDIAYVRGRYEVTLMPEGAPEPIRESGKWVAIMQKQPDGSWLTLVDIFNTDQPLPEEGSET